jgi:uncharacterized protein
MPNRLANETSPYLRQHADNPVDWYPWGEEAFRAAKETDRPILLSVGYSTCHWCHVMAHESFEDPAIAALMNEWFINVKVDREERPDVDSVYMTALQAMTGQGGWPMTIFLTPEGKPFFAGTYFPPEDAHGRPSFRRVLEAVHRAWTLDRAKVLESADHVAAELKRFAAASGRRGAVGEDVLDRAVDALRAVFDPEWGGFGSAPKFPSAPTLEFLLLHHARLEHAGRPDPGPWYMVRETLRQMACGGIYDQLGGGFARYSVDARWVVPHFEKMLYDNAQLLRLYAVAWQVDRDPLWARIVQETAAYLQRELLGPEGGFFSAQDADSEGIEGKFYLWTLDELRRILGPDADLAAAAFGVTEEGNFFDPHHPELRGRNVLTRRYDPRALAERFGLSAVELEARVEEMRERLFRARSERVPPATDDKVLASWNGLAIAAFAEAGRIFGDDTLVGIARTAASFLREQMWTGSELRHTYKDGVARVPGLLEDYAYVGLGLVSLYQATGELAWLLWARELWQTLLERFRDEAGGGFFETPRDGEELLLRQKPLFDASTPSGNGAAGQLAWWIGRYFGDPQAIRAAEDVVSILGPDLARAPNGLGALLSVAELLLAPHEELAIVGPRTQRAAFERVAAARFRPWLVLAPAEAVGGLPRLEGREAPPGEALAYRCIDFACELPAATPDELARQLGG